LTKGSIVRKRNSLRSFFISAFCAILTILITSCGEGITVNRGGSSSATLSGTAAVGKPIANVQLTIKGKNGKQKTVVTDATGKYSVDISDITTPALIKVPSGVDTLFSIVTSEGITNIHPFTNLILSNWFKANGTDVDTVFDSVTLSSMPTTEAIKTVESTLKNVLSELMGEAGLDSASFDLFTTPFEANGKDFDWFLDHLKVRVDKNENTMQIIAVAPDTGVEGTIMSMDLDADLATVDTIDPEVPRNLSVIPVDINKMMLVWDVAEDNVAVKGYNVYRDGVLIDVSPYPTYSDSRVTENTQYCYKIETLDGSGNVSLATSEVCGTPVTFSSNSPPSIPTALSVIPVSDTQIGLSWNPSTDDIGVLAKGSGLRYCVVWCNDTEWHANQDFM
jgi:hypothetical protein